MGSSRMSITNRSSRWCYRYRYAIYLALFFVVFQIIVAINFLTLDSQEQQKQRELHSLPREDRQADSGVHVAWLNSNHRFRVRPDLRNGDYDLNQAVGHSATNNHEDNILVIHAQQKLSNIPSNDRNAPRDKEAYRTKQDKPGAEGAKGAAVNGVNLVNKDTDSRHAHIVHSTLNVSKASADHEKPLAADFSKKDIYGGNGTTKTATYYPKCEVTRLDVEAKMAINRATTSECKQGIADTFCRMKEGTIYPMKLERLCPVEGKPIIEIDNLDEVNLSTYSSVRIAYIFVVHGRALRQVQRLIKLLYHSDHFFYIHVDERSDYLHRELSKIADLFPNIMMTPWRYATIWGGASLLTVYLRAMQDLLGMEGLRWDFLINLSESDFPIKTNAQLVKFLGYYRQNNFLKSHGRDESGKEADAKAFIRKQGLDRTFYECDTHMWRIGDRKLPEGILYDGGSDWFALNRDYCQYLMTANNTLVRGLRELYKYSLLPAESFFHLVLVNSEKCQTMVNNNLHITNWKRKLGCQCQYKHIVDWCGCSPNVFKPEDFYKIKNNRPLYFARKFEPIISQAVINQIDTHLYGSYPAGSPGYNTYFQNIYHAEDTLTKPSNADVTTYRSFLRIIKETVNFEDSSTDKNCVLQFPLNPREVSTYSRMDTIQGLIITAEIKDPFNRTQTMEAWLAPTTFFKLILFDGPGERLKNMGVGLNFDPKERIFRKYGNIMGPFDSPTFASHWLKGTECAVTITWIDPANHIAASFDTKIESDREELHHQPQFNKPLRPGKWTLKVLFKWQVVAETNFLIVPLSVFGNEDPISPSKASAINAGPLDNNYVGKDFSPLRSIFDLDDNTVLLAEANLNSKKTGKELEKWVDDSVRTFWNVAGFCIHREEMLTECSQIKLCKDYTWSTLSPDPKSKLGNVNAFGRLR